MAAGKLILMGLGAPQRQARLKPGIDTAGTRNAGVVEKDHRTPASESVGDDGIPMVHPAAEVLHEEQRPSRIFSEPPISFPRTARYTQLGETQHWG